MRLLNAEWIRRTGLALFTAVLATAVTLPQTANAHDSWWEENFEVHGFFTSKFFVRAPGLAIWEESEVSSWKTELNLEMNFGIYDGSDLKVSGYAIVRPTFDAIYYLNPNLWGDNVDRASAAPNGTATEGALAEFSNRGKRVPGIGGCLEDEFCINTSGTFFNYTGINLPTVSISTELFFGSVAAAWGPRSSLTPSSGGPTGRHRMDQLTRVGIGQGNAAILGNEALRGTTPGSIGNLIFGNDVATGLPSAAATPFINRAEPLNYYQRGRVADHVGGFGDAKSFNKGYDINRRQHELEMDCFDTAHPQCWLREMYVDIEYGRWFARIGKQQLSWGKTDAFRLQDKLNPLDVGYRSVFPDLEERRIPQFALDLIYSAGDIGPLQDVSVEFAWIFDRYLGDQAGQCGEPYAFTGLCHFRADIGGHGFFNFGSRAYDQVHWKLKNTEPWLRLEFRIPEPSISFSLSAGWTHSDAPEVEFIRGTEYSTTNPNPSVFPLLQAVGVGGLVEDCLDGACDGSAVAFGGTTPWSTGIDLYARGADVVGPTTGFRGQALGGGPDGIPDVLPGSTLDLANQQLIQAYRQLYIDECSGRTTNLGVGTCVAGATSDTGNGAFLQFMGFTWTGSEVNIRVPRIFTVGGSMDYQIPGIDTILRLEIATDFNRRITDSSRFNGTSKSHVFQGAIGLDRSTFIPFINKNRTAFLSFQTFVEHITDYRHSGKNRGMVPYETQIISTAFMQNYWRNDTIILTTFVAVLWKEGNVLTGPTLRYVHNEHLFFDLGISMIWGRKREHNIFDVCGNGGRDAGLGCLSDPDAWVPGQWTLLYQNLERDDESAYGHAKSGVGDRMMRERDEIWFGVTYQF